jgi:hypothetical protein
MVLCDPDVSLRLNKSWWLVKTSALPLCWCLVSTDNTLNYWICHWRPFENQTLWEESDFNFPIGDFPFIWSSLPAAIVYVVYISFKVLSVLTRHQQWNLVSMRNTYILRIKGFIFISHHLHSYSDKLKEDIALGITMVNYLALRQYHVYIQTV